MRAVSKNISTYRLALLGSMSLLAAFGGSAAMAQVEAADDVSSAAETAEPEESAIVVTGSRIARTGIDAPTPTVAMGAADIEAKGITNVVDLLNELPQISTGLSNSNTSFSFGNVGLTQV